ncbi:MAG: serine hydrolase [Flavobacteriaceae bacterium]|nr:serine hydrolase [Flavobacteriaceae bacterium]
MKRNLLFLLFFSILFSCQKQIEKKVTNQENDYTEAYQIAQVWLQGQIDYEQIPGITMSVVRGNKIDWNIALGFSDSESPLTPTSLFSICSISKLFTSIAIMQLVEQGKIKLNDPISRHLPYFSLEQQYSKSLPITIANILSHSSGLPRESNHSYWSPPDFKFPSKQEVIEGLSEQKTLYPAETYFQYSNLGLTLLGYLIEEVSKQSYSDYIQDHILDPLEMHNTKTFMDKSQYGKELVFGYSAKKRNGERDLVPFFKANGINAAAGYSSNTSDLAKFAIWQLKLLSGLKTSILNVKTLNQMHTTQLNDTLNNVKRGYGFGVYGETSKRTVGHGGSCPGYRSVLTINPKSKTAFAVMINANGTNPMKYANGVSDILDKVTLRKGNKPNKNKEVEGYYNGQPWSGETYISSWGDNIALLSLPNNNANLTIFKTVKKDIFRRILKNDSLGESLHILRNTKHEVIGYKRHQTINKKI